MQESEFKDKLMGLASELNINDGALLKLARDISQDGNLRTIDRLRVAHRRQLIAFLEKESASQTTSVGA